MIDPMDRKAVFHALGEQIAEGKLVLVVGFGFDFEMMEGTAEAWLSLDFPTIACYDSPALTLEVVGNGRLMFLNIGDEITAEVTGLQLEELGGPDLVVFVEEDARLYLENYNAFILPAVLKNVRGTQWVLEA